MNITHSYSNLRTLVAAALNDKSDMDLRDRHSRRVEPSDRRPWTGTNTWEQAATLATSGDMEGARRLAPQILDAVNASIAGMPRLDPVYKLDEGRWIDVARFVKGEPECWGDMVESAPTPRRGVNLVINVAASSRVDANEIDGVGVTIGGIVLGLQSLGYTVTVYLAHKIKGYGKSTSLVYAPINAGGITLDVSELSTLLRPWFLRRIIFSLEETYTAKERVEFNIGGSYGSVLALEAADTELITGTKDAIAIDISKAVERPDSIKAAVLKQIGGSK